MFRSLQVRRRAPGRSVISTIGAWIFLRHFTWLIFRLLYRIEQRGVEHVPERGSAIFASNHQSNLDPMIVGILTWDRGFAAMARSGLFGFKPLAWLMTFIGAIPIQRGKSDRAAMRTAQDLLEKGSTVLLFPEGTRSVDGSLGTFRRGVALLARRAKAPIVPVALEGATDIWPRGRKFPRLRGWIGVQAGPAITVEEIAGMSDDQTLTLLRERIDAMRRELSARLRERSQGRWPKGGGGEARGA